MDTDRALAKVGELLVLVDQSLEWVSKDNARYYSDEGRELSMQIRGLVPVVKRIAIAVDPDLQNLFVELPQRWEWATVHDGLLRLKGLLEHEQELADILGPAGPQASANQFHEWVWSSASALWSDGHRREAVQAAATQVEIHTRAKLNRHGLSGADLMIQAWSLDPPKKAAVSKLRFATLAVGTEEYVSAHEGAKFFGAGCMLGIRNVVTHSLEQPPEQAAIELLAALSVLARWIDSATVVAEEPHI